ncbi:MAG: methyltransferase domain-containing protein [Alphaproteobacteria bacterium]
MSAPRLFDQQLRLTRRRRAARIATRGADFLLRAAADDMVDRLAVVQRHFDLTVDIGAATSYLAERLADTGRAGRVIRLDALPDALPDVVASDAALPLANGSADLVVSALALQFCDDLPGALAQIRATLKPDGLFMGVLAAGDTLIELREALTTAEAELTGGAAPRIIPFAALSDIGALLQRAGFALPVVDRERVVVRYRSPAGLIGDLRAMGATNVLMERQRQALPRAVWRRCEEIYAARFSDDDGRVRATFDFIWLSGWAPHASQQQPLRPGSAKARLADALGTREQSAGDKAGN